MQAQVDTIRQHKAIWHPLIIKNKIKIHDLHLRGNRQAIDFTE